MKKYLKIRNFLCFNEIYEKHVVRNMTERILYQCLYMLIRNNFIKTDSLNSAFIPDRFESLI